MPRTALVHGRQPSQLRSKVSRGPGHASQHVQKNTAEIEGKAVERSLCVKQPRQSDTTETRVVVSATRMVAHHMSG
eukprot:2436447-Amphidinium_carterae.1